jgi:hypothetical protein
MKFGRNTNCHEGKGHETTDQNQVDGNQSILWDALAGLGVFATLFPALQAGLSQVWLSAGFQPKLGSQMSRGVRDSRFRGGFGVDGLEGIESVLPVK